ncbi:MAG: FG-GAP repeat domain-containing protein [Bryobacteraceae bacterium]
MLCFSAECVDNATVPGASGSLDIVRTNFSDQLTTLYRNNGDGTFRDASLEAGLGINRKYLGFGAGFFDYDNDGWEDIFLANGQVYSQIAGRGLYLNYKQPRLLYQNLRNGRFKDVFAEAGPGIQTTAVSRGCAFGDLDNDGDIGYCREQS